MLNANSKYILFKSRRLLSCTPVKKTHQFLVMLQDYKDPEALSRRLAAREEHLAGAKKAAREKQLLVGGAILDNHESSKMEGSFLLVSAESAEQVNEMIVKDPYYKAKAWEKWEVYPVKCAIGP
ncbi:hypothetical protein BD408DRAFT_9038 [Parasitella parasitica]|nr:hypothetical protein BD408DRAFT_9038 [Parasitella parasitica]